MQRNLFASLQAWKDHPHRKPLILKGARQVGKTWLLKEFGKQCFSSCVYVRMEDNAAMAQLFEGSLNPDRLLDGIAAFTGQPIIPGETLLILDEVQAVPRALTALKYFNEDAPQYAIAVAGSLLGVALHQGISFPVGKVSFLDLHPMSFTEFLLACKEDALVRILEERAIDMLAVFKERFTDLLRQYYFVGGMPEAVKTFVAQKDFSAVRAVQNDILTAYESDFSKHQNEATAERCRQIWQSIPRQLAKENKKFVYGVVKQGARGRELSEALQFLEDCSLVIRVDRIAKPGIPLASYKDSAAFKLYLVDVGLLGAMAGLDSKSIIEGNRLFEEFKGSLVEQYVCQQLVADCGLHPYYWSAEKSSGEVDFIVQSGGEVIPLEVKAEENLKGKSLASFCEKYHLETAVRLSLAGYRDQGWLTNIPLYAARVLRPSHKA
ncbi:MAG: ATP-binding protein [Raoultibacter sp.]